MRQTTNFFMNQNLKEEKKLTDDKNRRSLFIIDDRIRHNLSTTYHLNPGNIRSQCLYIRRNANVSKLHDIFPHMHPVDHYYLKKIASFSLYAPEHRSAYSQETSRIICTIIHEILHTPRMRAQTMLLLCPRL